MSKHSNLPYHLYINVNNEALGNLPKGTTKAIWHSIYGREYQLILCHILLESGAHWSGMPLHQISTTTDFSFTHSQLMPWKCMGEDLDVVHIHYLEGLKTSVKNVSDGRHTGVMVDWKDGYSRYQQEHKPLNLIHLDNGQFGLFPNNYCLFDDAHFTNKDLGTTGYRRGEEIFWEG